MNEVQGIDVSHYQLNIDWAKVAQHGIKFAIMKAQYEAQSHRKDEYFEQNYSGAQAHGIAKGVYIYIARASMADPIADAHALLSHLNGRKLEYGIWLDLEDASVAAKGKAYIRNLSYQYAEMFKKAGYYVGIYCNKDWYSRLIHEDLKKDFDFWIARYPKNDNGTYNAASSLRPSGNIAVAWQYSSKGKVPGIKGNVDLDVDFDGIVNLTSTPIDLVNPYKEPFTDIKRGMSGNVVKWIQWQLNKLGYGLKEDGIFGNNTRDAVIDFQDKHGLLGIVDTDTREALKNL